jgi:hypothetical protein
VAAVNCARNASTSGHFPATRLPFAQAHAQYVLLELSDTASADTLITRDAYVDLVNES